MRREHHILNHLVSLRYGDRLAIDIAAGPAYLSPTKPLFYGDPKPANGNRTPAELSPVNYRGSVVSENDNRELTFESNVERNALLVFQAEPDVAEIRTQWPTVKYRLPDGSVHKHTFDAFIITKKHRQRVCIAAKPLSLFAESDLLTTLLCIHDQGMGGGVADKISFVTEAYASASAAANAQMILYARRARNEMAYDVARGMLDNIVGPVRFRNLLAGANHVGTRRIALWCLIDEGLLRPLQPGRIDDHTMMIAVR